MRRALGAVAPGWGFEARLWGAGHTPVAGVDEAGRGAWAGPVVAAAVVLPPGRHPFRDSKTVSPARRETLAGVVRAVAIGWGVGYASAADVDGLGVLAATHLAASRALACLQVRPGALVTDYLRLAWAGPVLAPPRADGRSVQVAAASLLAKTERDRWMADAAEAKYPGYGFAAHKGYGAPTHLAMLEARGPCPLHRRRFAPVRAALER